MIQPVVLAAGLSTRFGANKALVTVAGRPALTAVLDTILSCTLTSPIVVLGHHADEISHRIDLDSCQVVINPHPESGMSHSLKLGLDAVNQMCDGVLLFLVDMPFITSPTVRMVIQAVANGAELAAPYYKGTRGFPVFFGRNHLFGLRQSLRGDAGGRAYLAAHNDDIACLNVEDAGCVFDIDHPSDLALWEGETLCAISE
jgi:CTP:molybdopterin cytidylyltransferase MocA